MSNKKSITAREKYENKTFDIGGQEVKVVKYVNTTNILIQFPDKHITTTYLSCINKKVVKDVMSPSVVGYGYLGVGHQKTKDENGKDFKSYNMWASMIRRVFLPDKDRKNDLKICDEWLNYQEFANWFDLNYYEIEDCEVIITNTFFNKDEKMYSPETTIFLPRFINLLINTNGHGDKKLPRGISYDCKRFIEPYRVSFKKYKENTKCYGSYQTFQEAYKVLKYEKEKYIHEVADELIDVLPYKIFSELKNYKMEDY